MPQLLTNLRLQKNYSTMQENEIAEASDLLAWYRSLLALMGIWPKDNNDVRFALSFSYLFIHVAMEYGDLIKHFGNLEEIVANLSENTAFTMMLVKLVVFRKNRMLSQLIDAMNEDRADAKNRTSKEQMIYALYNGSAKTIYKIIAVLVTITGIFYYVSPLATHLFTTSNNGTISFLLPYRTRLFYEITDVYTYSLTYAYQVVAFFMVCFGYTAADGLLISMILHVCGQLSGLADSIANLKNETKNDHYLQIRSIVKRHLRLIWMAEKIDKAFAPILLGQLLGTAILITLNGFNVILNSEKTQNTNLLTFAFFEASMLSFLYSYCFIGECLIKESERLHEAFYQCAWYEMPASQSIDLIICMAESQKILHLTAAKFYTFSLKNFTQIVKTSMGYLSVLRTVTALS